MQFSLKSRGIQVHPLIGFSIGLVFYLSALVNHLCPKYGIEPPSIFGFLTIFLCPVYLLIIFAPSMKIWTESEQREGKQQAEKDKL